MLRFTGTATITAPGLLRTASRLLFAVYFCMFALLSVRTAAQVPQDSNTPPAEQILASYEGQPVTTVDIAGRPDLKVSQFTSNLAQQPGQPFDKQKVDRTVAALKTAGKFQNVRIQ